MDAIDRRRLEAYVRDQNFYRGVAEDFAERTFINFIERALPWVVERARYAVQLALQLSCRFGGC
jgi:hypothetical protein